MFAIRLKELRMKFNLTQRQFAEIMQISAGTVGNWESGNREPDFEMLLKIANFFKIDTDYLLGREENHSRTITAITEYTEEEKQIIKDYRSLSPDLKEMIRKTLDIYTQRDTKKINQ